MDGRYAIVRHFHLHGSLVHVIPGIGDVERQEFEPIRNTESCTVRTEHAEFRVFTVNRQLLVIEERRQKVGVPKHLFALVPLVLFVFIVGDDDRLVLPILILTNQVLHAVVGRVRVWRDERRQEFHDCIAFRIIRHQRFRDGHDLPAGCHECSAKTNLRVWYGLRLDLTELLCGEFTEDSVVDLIIMHTFIFPNPRVVLLKKQRRGGEPRRCRFSLEKPLDC